MPLEVENRFIAHLKSLAQREDRGALAALRRGLGESPGACAEMHPHVVPFLPPNGWTWYEECHYIIAALFGLHPQSAASGNMGDTLRAVATAAGSDDSTERRFIALLKCHRDDLFGHIRHAVSLAKSKDVPVNWSQLLKDIQNWDSEWRSAQRNWARSFWGASAVAEERNSEPSVVGEKQ
jgi:CRISPR system Cascade subunit CasB